MYNLNTVTVNRKFEKRHSSNETLVVSAMILTSNRDVSEWGQIFPEPVLASAAIDRIFDRADIVLFRGERYRLKGRINQREIDEVSKE